MTEFYIQDKGSGEARGPYDLGQLQSLAETGKLTDETHYFDDEKDEWVPVKDNEALMEELYPKKEPIRLKKKSKVEVLNKSGQTEDGPDNRLGVQEFLAAAEGRTTETRHLKKRQKSAEKAAGLAPLFMAAMLIIGAIGLVAPSIDVVQAMLEQEDYLLLLKKPFILIGIVDVLFAVLLLLGVTDIFALLRIRAVVGIGYFGYTFWALSNLSAALAVAIGGLGLYICTITLRLPVMLASGAIGILGMIGFTSLYFLG